MGVALGTLSDSGELIWMIQKKEVARDRREGLLSLSGWYLAALVRECGEPVVLRLSRRGTGWHTRVAVTVGSYVPE